MAEEPAPALVATPHEAQKTVLDQTLRSKRQGVNIACDFTLLGAIGARAGGANVLRATARVRFWGALAMALIVGIGNFSGTVV